jgi:hypothetical protein
MDVVWHDSLWACLRYRGAGSILSRHLSRRMQRLEERDQRSSLRRTQGFSVGGHVAAALNHLPDELILRELEGDTIERRPALSSDISQCVTVVALLGLKNKRTLTL